jgi:nitrite reductase/ring-hydroxylating ferredoxin subunit
MGLQICGMGRHLFRFYLPNLFSSLFPRSPFLQESHGRKLLLVRHPKSGTVSVMDAHCFHMGTPLIGGDIEDLDGHACVVCPAHRYRIDIATGHKVDTDLCGKTCSSEDQKQRLYSVHCDEEFIWVDLPTDQNYNALAPLPSDYYNQVAQQQQQLHVFSQQQQQQGIKGTLSQGNYGLFGAASDMPPPPSPLQPYAGVTAWPVVPPSTTAGMGTPSKMAADDPQLVLSQQSMQSSPAPAAPPANLMNYFPSAKPDPPHVARRKAATAAILARSYKPPTADNTPMQSPQKPVVQQQIIAPVVPAPVAPAPVAAASSSGNTRQATLMEAWARRPVSAGVESMDMN